MIFQFLVWLTRDSQVGRAEESQGGCILREKEGGEEATI